MAEMTPVTSSNLAAVGYDPDSNQLFIQFLNGSMYMYSGVPQEVYDGIMSAGSKGSFFHHNIKTAGYPYQKL